MKKHVFAMVVMFPLALPLVALEASEKGVDPIADSFSRMLNTDRPLVLRQVATFKDHDPLEYAVNQGFWRPMGDRVFSSFQQGLQERSGFFGIAQVQGIEVDSLTQEVNSAFWRKPFQLPLKPTVVVRSHF